MSNSKSAKKQNKFGITPLVMAVAILEVIILICVSTYAWFVFADNNSLFTDVIEVAPDSGLEIDFSEADTNDHVDIRKYINEFSFEPVTSMDGRNIFIPTTGTFDSTNTNDIVFREATVNDMNSKYVCIDFTLTNNNPEKRNQEVWLSSKSSFTINDGTQGKALRLAFYQNDGSSGDVSSSILAEDTDVTKGKTTVYFNNNFGWDNPHIYMFDKDDSDKSPADFPGFELTPISGDMYYCTFDNKYETIIFNDGVGSNDGGEQTINITATDGYIYSAKKTGQVYLDPVSDSWDWTADGARFAAYFYGPDGNTWVDAVDSVTSGYKAADIPEGNWTHVIWARMDGSTTENNWGNRWNQSADIPLSASSICEITGADKTHKVKMLCSEDDYDNYVSSDGGYAVISPGVSTGFQRPYAPVLSINNNTGAATNVVGAFASSIDNYNYGSKSLFSIDYGETISLSMIIWLEGTDPDCTGENYAGKEIDLNLIFAIGDSGESMYEYRFLDKTKENWTNGVIKTATGLSYPPVMQLYDVDNNKGYLMKLTQDSNQRNIWSCVAPAELKSSKNISFRRVNPLDETEIWNYWDTSGFGGTMFSNAFDDETSGSIVNDKEINGTVNFTALADGAPTPTDLEGTGAPELSCGGLWGNIDTAVLTVYDGTTGGEGRWLHFDSAALTINYTYQNQTIEYKGSGTGDLGFTYFVVPADLCSGVNTKFKRYYNFDGDYALNLPQYQPKLKFDSTSSLQWDATPCTGMYYQIAQSSENGSFSNYWGSDLLYIQSDSIFDDAFSKTKSFMQVHFYSSNKANTNTDGSDHYAFLHSNDKFKGGSSGTAFACVIPNDKKYYYYRVERCNPGAHSEVYNATVQQPIVEIDDAYIANAQQEDSQLNTSTMTAQKNHADNPLAVSNNICKLEYYELSAFLQIQTTLAGPSWDPEYYPYGKDTGYGEESEWPGKSLTWVADYTEGGVDYKLYKSTTKTNVSKYDTAIYSNENGGKDAVLDDNTVTVYIGSVSYITKTPTIHWWNSSQSGNVVGTSINKTYSYDVGYWTSAQSFKIYKAEVPASATNIKVWYQDGAHWSSDDMKLNQKEDTILLSFEWGGTYYNVEKPFRYQVEHSLDGGKNGMVFEVKGTIDNLSIRKRDTHINTIIDNHNITSLDKCIAEETLAVSMHNNISDNWS